MPRGIVQDRKRGFIGDYVGRMTTRGYRGKLVRSNPKATSIFKSKITVPTSPIPDSTPIGIHTHAPSTHDIPDPTPSDLPIIDPSQDDHSDSGDFFAPLEHDPKDPYRLRILERPTIKTSQGTVSRSNSMCACCPCSRSHRRRTSSWRSGLRGSGPSTWPVWWTRRREGLPPARSVLSKTRNGAAWNASVLPDYARIAAGSTIAALLSTRWRLGVTDTGRPLGCGTLELPFV